MAVILKQLHFQKGSRDIVVFPLLQNLGVTHALSLGPEARNMAEAFAGADKQIVIKRQTAFLAHNNFAPFSQAFISIVPPKGVDPVMTISRAMQAAAGSQIIQAETMFTTEKYLPLLHKPADCPTMIIVAKTKNNEPILGLSHLGRPQVNDRMTEKAFTYLFEQFTVDPEDVFVAISPSIGPTYYTIAKTDQDANNFLDLAYWDSWVMLEKNQDGSQHYHVDVLGKILSILKEFAIPDQQIEAYGYDDAVDTFALARKHPPEAFSHRFATSTQQPARNGRFLVAAQLG